MSEEARERGGFREPNEWERALFDRLLTIDFQGRQEIKEQLTIATVRVIDRHGSLAVRSPSLVFAKPQQRIAVEAYATDVDQVPIEVLMHVVDGRVCEIEIHRADGASIKRMPSAEEFSVMSLPPPPRAS